MGYMQIAAMLGGGGSMSMGSDYPGLCAALLLLGLAALLIGFAKSGGA